MRSLCTKMLAVAVVALLVAPAFAQRQGGGRQGGRGGFGGFGGFGGRGGMQQGSMLLLNKSVQEELKLTDEQKAELTKAQEKQREAMRSAFQGGGGGTRDFAKIRETMQKLSAETTKATDKVKDGLKPEQAKRFKQIQLQVGMQFNPLAALNNADVQKDLALNDKQKQELKALAEDTRKDMEEINKERVAAGRDREKQQEIGRKVQALNKEATGKAKAVLTDDQKKSLTELEGAKFEFKPDQFGGGRQGGGRRRQQQKQ